MPLDNFIASINIVYTMDNRYNLYNFEAKFEDYLISQKYGLVTIKSYVSDLHLLLLWLTSIFDIDSLGLNGSLEYKTAQLLTVQTLHGYFAELAAKNIPEKTILRKLSSLQLACSFCIDQQWMNENPVRQLRLAEASARLDNPLRVLGEFKAALKEIKTSESTIKNYLADIREFITITSSIKSL